MLVYKTPTIEAFKKRKQFYTTQKEHGESISDWFKRLQQSITKCEYDVILEYMLIDKFVMGLDEMDFQKISQVASWTLQDLILVVIGNEHIFNKAQTKNHQPSEDIASVNVKFESELQLSDAESGPDENFNGDLNEDVLTANAELNEFNDNPVELSRSEKIRQQKCSKNKRYLQKLKETGQYAEYKKKQAELMRRRRFKIKQTEQYLPPEIKMHVTSERRRATRERVKRYRDRKLQETMEKTNIKPKSESKQKVQPKLAFASEPDFSLGNDMQQQDFDFDPFLETETERCETIEPKQEPESTRPPPKRTIKKESQVIKPKSGYQRKRTFECYQCSLACSKLYELRTHLQVFHPFEELKKDVLNCPYCTKTTISRKVLSTHLKECHATLQMHKCPCCDEEFKKRGQLTDHTAKQHKHYRPYICETCASSFISLSELNSHRRRHSGIVTSCPQCGKIFASRSSIKSHMMIHTGERPYACTFCEKSFRQQSSFNKHLLSVHKQGEKKYVCKICEKRFASIYHLRIHENIHTGARPYQCDYCESDFNQPSALKTHVNRVHLKQPKPVRKKSQTN